MFQMVFIITNCLLLSKNTKFTKFNFKLIKIYMLFNIFFYLLYNTPVNSNLVNLNLLIMSVTLLYFSNFLGIFAVTLIISCTSNNLMINLVLLEMLNLIFFINLKKNYFNQRNIIIFNFLISIIYIFTTLAYFFHNFGTVNFNTLLELEPKLTSLFILIYIFFKMGGIVGLQY